MCNSHNGQTLWKVLEENAKGQTLKESKGGKQTVYGYDGRGLPTSIKAEGGIIDYAYAFTPEGNLKYRIDHINQQREDFVYDELNRLTDWNITAYTNPALVLKANGITYNPTTGNITTKTDLANVTLNYGEADASHTPGVKAAPGIHALTSLSAVPEGFPTANLQVSYTDFKKIASLTEGNKQYLLSYGVDEQRCQSIYKVAGEVQLTRYYVGDYEEEVASNGNVRKIHYLPGAILIQNNGKDSLLYAYTDYQGSLVALADEAGNVVERYAYDPWGARRNPDDWTQKDNRTSWIVNRGYTGHEHLDAFGIINMNGRVYDPLTAMFFSPDPYVQAGGNWLNYNRYGYCYNNPLKYTDPTGEFFWMPVIIGAVIGGVMNGIQAERNGGHFWDGAWKGALVGALGGAMGAGFVQLGVAWGVSGVLPGMAYGAATGAVTGAVTGGMASSLNGGNFWDGAGQGALYGAAFGAVSGGISGGIDAYHKGNNVWWGSEVGNKRTQWSFFNWDLPNETVEFNMTFGVEDGNNCVPLSFSELENARGGSRTYDDFVENLGVDTEKGLLLKSSDYGDLLSKNGFNNEALAQNKLTNIEYMKTLSKNGDNITAVYPKGGIRHWSNLKSIDYYPKERVVLNFRGESFDFIKMLSRHGRNANFFRVY